LAYLVTKGKPVSNVEKYILKNKNWKKSINLKVVCLWEGWRCQNNLRIRSSYRRI